MKGDTSVLLGVKGLIAVTDLEVEVGSEHAEAGAGDDMVAGRPQVVQVHVTGFVRQDLVVCASLEVRTGKKSI